MSTLSKRTLVGAVAAALVIACSVSAMAALGASGSGAAGSRRPIAQPPRYSPNDYTTRIDNPWFPLRPGTTYIYEGVESGARTRDRMTVTSTTKNIDGIDCRVISDKVFKNGRLAERTKDYYTQDEDGNVWYFGEDTAELDKHGNVTSRDGTWRTGRNGARAGVFMQSFPQKGASFYQELDRGNAEDHYLVQNLTSEVKVPYGHFGRNPLRRSVEKTKEWSPLEPNIREVKFYAFGVGQISGHVTRGPREYTKLVKVIKG
jgi:hypothetical protein